MSVYLSVSVLHVCMSLSEHNETKSRHRNYLKLGTLVLLDRPSKPIDFQKVIINVTGVMNCY